MDRIETRLDGIERRMDTLEARLREVEIQLSCLVKIAGSMHESYQLTAQQHDARLSHLETPVT